jgi:hypothetical protein
MPGIEDFLRRLDDNKKDFISLFTRHKIIWDYTTKLQWTTPVIKIYRV